MSRAGDDVGDDEQGCQPAHHGRPLVVATVAVSAAVAVVLLLPLPDTPRRSVVLGLLAVLITLQVPLVVRAWRSGRRPLSPRWLRLTHQLAWFWGFLTAGMYTLPILGHQPALSSVLGGTVTALLYGVMMWFSDPGRPATREPTARTTAIHDDGQRS